MGKSSKQDASLEITQEVSKLAIDPIRHVINTLDIKK